jgi:S-adenosylmethionine-diacylglycerol 3-amino-3-carboxypropyl transferase
MSFATSLNFTSANEDGATELSALASKAGDRVLCLTASGSRPLDLLLGDASQIVALDLNPAQNRLLALKMAAIKALDYEDLLAWLGIAEAEDRLALHRRVETDLTPEDREWWRAKRGIIKAGVWHAGRWEKVLRLGAWLTRLARGRSIDRLFDAPTVQDQARVWASEFDDSLWRGAIQLLSRPWFWTHIIGEPGGAFLPDPNASQTRLAGVFSRGAGSVSFNQSDFMTLVFRGKHTAESALPRHLKPGNFALVRERLSRITIAQGGLADLQGLNLGPFDGFSLSDFGSYCSGAAYDACWSGVLASAAPGARWCERVFMNPVLPSQAIQSVWGLDRELSEKLTQSDRAVIYDIRAGQLGSSR